MRISPSRGSAEHTATSDTKMCADFIGIGPMGTPISHNILKAGFPLTAYGRYPAQTAPFAALGAPMGSGCAVVARKSDGAFMMMGQAAEEPEAVLGPGACLKGPTRDRR
jgi:3-hydroxyisobutyrate dehydrogenase-like beta-hydroxyacid dehydrogenase